MTNCRDWAVPLGLTIIGHRSGARCPVDLIGPLLVLVVPFVALLLGGWLLIVLISRGRGR